MARRWTRTAAALLSFFVAPTAFAESEDTETPDERRFVHAGSREEVRTASGALLAWREDVAPHRAPPELRRAVARQFGAPTLWRVERYGNETDEAWLLTFSRGDRLGEALFTGDGRLVRATLRSPDLSPGSTG